MRQSDIINEINRVNMDYGLKFIRKTNFVLKYVRYHRQLEPQPGTFSATGQVINPKLKSRGPKKTNRTPDEINRKMRRRRNNNSCLTFSVGTNQPS
jgi:hypothetical protein